MSDWRSVLGAITDDVEGHFDELKQRLLARLHRDYPLMIAPYIGYGTAERIYLKGRVLADRGITSAEENDTIWENMLSMYRRFDSLEVPRARLKATVGEAEVELLTDDEGYFEQHIDLHRPLPQDDTWHTVKYELLEVPGEEQPPEAVWAVGKFMLPPPDAQFGVISDLDDTVIKTDVLNYLKMARNVFLHNARTRLPFEGVAAFYRALQKGTNGSLNPIFYLSKSPWNIYDLLVDFFEVRDIPAGPLLLTDLGFSDNQFLFASTRGHKLTNIQALLDTFPHLPFILIGDSGQHDPEIYVEAAQLNPGRIPAIYIRDVTDDLRETEIQALVEQASEAGADLLLVEDTAAAQTHALAQGFIEPETLPEIDAERAEDKKEPPLVEKLLDPQG